MTSEQRNRHSIRLRNYDYTSNGAYFITICAQTREALLGVLEPGDVVGDGLRPSPKHGLTEIVRALKSFSARRINEAQGTQGQAFWQRGFYDHIVRLENDLEDIRQYILENPRRAFLKGLS